MAPSTPGPPPHHRGGGVGSPLFLFSGPKVGPPPADLIQRADKEEDRDVDRRRAADGGRVGRCAGGRGPGAPPARGRAGARGRGAPAPAPPPANTPRCVVSPAFTVRSSRAGPMSASAPIACSRRSAAAA